LNNQQRRAFHSIFEETVTIGRAPPGTGKTKRIAKAMIVMMMEGQKPFVVAQSNLALDNKGRTQCPG
jgi:phosphate starvation-inducible protein PhoH